MIRPQRFFIMPRSAARARRKPAVRLTSSTGLPVLVLHAHRQIVAGDAGIVDQDVDAAGRGLGRLGHRIRRRRRREVAGRRHGRARPAPRPAPPAPRRGAGQHHGGALGVQRARDGAADAARSAGDERRLPVRSNMLSIPCAAALCFRRRSMRSRRRSPPASAATPRRGRVDALGEAGQHLAGAELDQFLRRPRIFIVKHALAPAHRAGDLLDQQAADLVRVGDRRGGDVGDQRHGRRRSSTSASASRIASAAGAISGQWKGALTGSRMLRLAPLGGQRDRPLDRRLVAADHDLARRVVVGRSCRSTSRGRGARRRSSRAWSRSRPSSAAMAPSRPAPPSASPGRAAAAAGPRRRADRAGRGQRRVFAQAVAGDEAGEIGERLARPLRHRARRRRPRPPSAPAGRSRSASASRCAVEHQLGQLLVQRRRRPPRRPRARRRRPSASALPMPTAWLPWPGNTKARAMAAFPRIAIKGAGLRASP